MSHLLDSFDYRGFKGNEQVDIASQEKCKNENRKGFPILSASISSFFFRLDLQDFFKLFF